MTNNKNNKNNRNVWLDGIMGVAVGDALGLPVQFESREALRKDPVTEMLPCDLFFSPIGTWSDDTAMTIAMFESINRLGHVDADDIMQNFIRWQYEGEFSANDRCIDEGITCSIGITNYKENVDIYTCGRTGEHANGNGSLMRTLPISIYYAKQVKKEKATIEEAIKDIHLVSALTHNHLRACIACGLYFFCVTEIIYGEGDLMTRLQTAMDAGFRFYDKSEETREDLSYYGAFFDLSEFAKQPEGSIKSTGYVVDSYEAAIWSLINTDSYRNAMIKAVNLGDDTDTVAAIAGGLAGLYYGYDAIPEEWLAVLRKREWLEQMCDSVTI